MPPLNGFGRSRYERCPECKGAGGSWNEYFPLKWRYCAACSGTGEVLKVHKAVISGKKDR